MIPVPPTVFSALPSSASRLGLIEFQLIPIFFNIGVNEQALLADKFGDMSIVNATNLQSFERLDIYHRQYQKLMVEHFPGKSNTHFVLSKCFKKNYLDVIFCFQDYMIPDFPYQTSCLSCKLS